MLELSDKIAGPATDTCWTDMFNAVRTHSIVLTAGLSAEDCGDLINAGCQPRKMASGAYDVVF